MKTFNIVSADSEDKLSQIAVLANEIWHQHFTDIIGVEQVNYMVEKFQSLPALLNQVSLGYEYYQLLSDGILSGYTGVHEENGTLFLSKLYIKKDARDQHLSTQTLDFLKEMCIKRNLHKIWLTCNKNNEHTLSVYNHFGFIIAREQKSDIGNGFYMDDYILEFPISPATKIQSAVRQKF